VTPRVDYCNSLLYGSPKYILNKLQTVHNTAARVIRTPRYCHITPCVKGTTLASCAHQSRVQTPYICVKVLYRQAPTYIRNMLDIYITSRQLRSQNNCLTLVVPRSTQSQDCDLWWSCVYDGSP